MKRLVMFVLLTAFSLALLTPVNALPNAAPAVAQYGATATVTAYYLNVRNMPNPYTGVILTRISRGQTYGVVGRNLDSSWLQLSVNGLVGWVNAGWVYAINVQYVPVTDNSSQPTGASAIVTAFNLNVRNIPNPYTGAIVARISQGQSFPVLGRNLDGSWLQLNVNGIIGWVNAGWVYPINTQGVPITDNSLPTPPAPVTVIATVTAYYLNVRSIPNPIYGAVVVVIGQGQTYSAIGRNANTSWLQLNVNGLVGWVNAGWVYAPNAWSLPVTG
jgi:uncharacterized protein YraI